MDIKNTFVCDHCDADLGVDSSGRYLHAGYTLDGFWHDSTFLCEVIPGKPNTFAMYEGSLTEDE